MKQISNKFSKFNFNKGKVILNEKNNTAWFNQIAIAELYCVSQQRASKILKELKEDKLICTTNSCIIGEGSKATVFYDIESVKYVGIKTRSNVGIEVQKEVIQLSEEYRKKGMIVDSNRADPGKLIDKTIETYQKKGHSTEWIIQRLKTIGYRKELGDKLKEAGIKDKEYGIITNTLYKAWSGLTARGYRDLKRLKKKDNLRDHFTTPELICTEVSESVTKYLMDLEKPTGFRDCNKVAINGGEVAYNLKRDIELRTGKNVVTENNNLLR
ncbi:hypothetical protein [Methanobrevibacter filiformis]|uniref:Bro-N domain-containing protein n=1 Tax=Methanobrevibacter filiformis TaxID=55758 RepID=A0A166FFX9_9EURY|nr:hypothetical protein [Methanobrevibacter filiformis]KZX17635.1 hypothetical protein MBFIL_00220 [Methanobrevibacter filiformis]